MPVNDIDHGWKRIKKELHLAKNSYTKVGIQHDAGANEGVSIAKYAADNEFGVPEQHIPARPFMRSSFDKNRNEIKKIQTSQIINRLTKHVLGDLELSSTQVTAALGLIKKTLPDISAVSIEGTGDDGEVVFKWQE